jgi:hypothetical protein
LRASISCLVWSCALLLSAAASAGGTPERESSPRRIAPPTRIPDPIVSDPTAEAVQTAAVPRAVRRAVAADAARRFGVAENAVVLVREERVTWPDGALGCPEPGRLYTQALVPGYRIVAKSGDRELLYHSDESGGGTRTCGGFVTRGQSVHERLKGKPVEPVTQPPTAPKE